MRFNTLSIGVALALLSQLLTATGVKIQAAAPLTFPSSGSAQQPQNLDPVNVEFCQLVTNPQAFRDRLVRVKAIFETTFEWRRLYDDACRSSKNYVWPVFECDSIESCEKFRYVIRKKMVGNPFSGQRVGVVLLGRFRESNSPKGGFGVQPGIRFQLEIVKVEATERVSTGIRKSKKIRFR